MAHLRTRAAGADERVDLWLRRAGRLGHRVVDDSAPGPDVARATGLYRGRRAPLERGSEARRVRHFDWRHDRLRVAGNAGLRVADFVRGLRHHRHSCAADLSPSARANALRFAMVPLGRAVLVSVDLLDRESVAGLFSCPRRAASGRGLVVCEQPESDLAGVHRTGGDFLLPAQADRAPALQQLSRDPRLLDARAVWRLGRHPFRRARARLDAEPEHGVHGPHGHSTYCHHDQPQQNFHRCNRQTERKPAAKVRRVRRGGLPARRRARHRERVPAIQPDHALHLVHSGPDSTVPLRLFCNDDVRRDLPRRAVAHPKRMAVGQARPRSLRFGDAWPRVLRRFTFRRRHSARAGVE